MKKYLSFVLVLTLTFTLLFAVQYPLTLVDDAGHAVTFENAPQRVISAAPSITDFLLELGYSKNIVGVTKYDSYTKATNIGLMYPLNMEKILYLKPDVVFMFGGFQLSQYQRLSKIGVKAFVLNANNLDGVYRDLMDVATIMGDPQKGQKLVSSLEEKVLKISKAAYNIPIDKRPKVFYGTPGKQIWTAGMGSFLNEVISLAGGVNVTGNYAGPNGWLPVSPEFVVAQNPDVILVPYFAPNGQKAAVKAFESYPAFKNLKAVKEGHVYAIDGNVASQPNTKLVGLLEELYNIFSKLW
ncbi:ABC transporter substrate-binding protein [Mesoaciditoga lauensis]|uniref:ABC transporter substrate-binding protein n=1 Tax=Mesoaciditoga lauensis TaxID=1495039 RepID=UPI00068B4148|nr:ABC transporter substrate-binding protein [Mesoaciditoga lauensis]